LQIVSADWQARLASSYRILLYLTPVIVVVLLTFAALTASDSKPKTMGALRLWLDLYSSQAE